MRSVWTLAALSISFSSTGHLRAEVPGAEDAQAEPSEQKLNEAKERFKQGIALAKVGNCSGAVAELEASYALAPRPNTLFNIARCQEELFRYTEAVASYELYLENSDAEDPERPVVESTIRSLKNLLGTLTIQSNVEAEVWVGGRRVGQSSGHILVPGGHHVVELRAEGYGPRQKEIDIAGRQSLDLSFELQENKMVELTEVTQVNNVTQVEQSGLRPAYFWSGVGLSSAALVGGIAFGLKATSQEQDAKDTDPRLPRQSQIDAIDQSKTTADIFFIAAGALAVGTTVLYFLTDWDTKEATERRLTISPFAGAHSLGFALGGSL